MACKGESDQELFETEFGGRMIDLRRFAYDFFVYSAETFGIPRKCIGKSQDRANNYGCSDILPVISRLIFSHQIDQRHSWYQIFKGYYVKDKLESFNAVSDLWVTAVICTITKYPFCVFLIEVEILLALTNELIQFLYSKDRGLYVADLAELWCDWILNEKETFEKYVGVDKMYQYGQLPCLQRLGDFYVRFIKEYYVNYEISVTEEMLKDRMRKSLEGFKETCGPEDFENESALREIYHPYKCGEPDATLTFDNPFESGVYELAAYETISRREFLRFIRSMAFFNATRLHHPSEQNRRYSPRRRSRSSTSPKRRNIKGGSREEQSRTSRYITIFSRRSSPGSSGSQKKQNYQNESGSNKFSFSSLYTSVLDKLSSDATKNRRKSNEQKTPSEDDSNQIEKRTVDPQALSGQQTQSGQHISSPNEGQAFEMAIVNTSETSDLKPHDTGAVPKKPLRSPRLPSGDGKEDSNLIGEPLGSPIQPSGDSKEDSNGIGEQAVHLQALSSEQQEKSGNNISTTNEERALEPASVDTRDRDESSGKQEEPRKPSTLETVEQLFPQISLESQEEEQPSEMTSTSRPTEIQTGTISENPERQRIEQESTGVSSTSQEQATEQNSDSSEEELPKASKAIPGTYWVTSV